MIKILFGSPGRLMLALATGFALGLGSEVMPFDGTTPLRAIGAIWSDCLRILIVPLIFALVATGVARASIGIGTEGDTLALRTSMVFIAMLLGSALVAVVVAPTLVSMWTLSPEALHALRFKLGVPPAAEVPSFLNDLRATIPIDVVASELQGAIVMVVAAALLLGLALGRVSTVRASALNASLQILADVSLLVLGWLLMLAPIAVFCLAFLIGDTIGIEAGLVLGYYILSHILMALLLIAGAYGAARFGGKFKLGRFARAVAPAQAVAAGTQSSLASLPSMLLSAHQLGVPRHVQIVVLPLAVATFKVSAPAASLIIGLTLARLGGVDVGAGQLALAVPLAVLSTLAVVGLPGSVGFFAAATPTAVALGAPIELLPILLAVDSVADPFQTIANVTADVAATTIIARRSHGAEVFDVSDESSGDDGSAELAIKREPRH